MPDPHSLLDTYAAGTSGLGTTEEAAPEAIAALRKVLDITDYLSFTCRKGRRHVEVEDLHTAITTALGGGEK